MTRHTNLLLTALLCLPCLADEPYKPDVFPGDERAETTYPLTDNGFYGPKGLQYQSPTSETDLWLGFRMQTRYDSLPGNFATLDQLENPPDDEVDFNRGRFKGGGSLGIKPLVIYSEYDWVDNRLLDLRLTYTLNKWLDMRMGQWKSEYNRERVDSSGNQQFAERSISTYWFTVDRQIGLSLSPRLARGSRADTRLWFQYLSGTGRGNNPESGSGLFLARAQWNPSGNQLAFSQADFLRRDKLISSFAVATVLGDSPYTRFSSSGGGQLPGYKQGSYELRQFLFETAFHYRGMGWQQELHFKTIKDKQTGAKRNIWGGYAQVGSFLQEWVARVPSNLELVGRIAYVDPDTPQRSDEHWEGTVAANWYFNRHRNKITVDYSRLSIEEGDTSGNDHRLRVQWELSL